MTVKIVEKGSIFDSEMRTLTNPVNCMGIMSAGLAREFAERYPILTTQVTPGWYRGLKENPWMSYGGRDHDVLNFPTKFNPNDPKASYDLILRGLEWLLENHERAEITSLAVPALGCGLGRLDWRIIKPVLIDYLIRLPIPVELYGPKEKPIT